LVALSPFSGNTEKGPPEARAVTSTEKLSVKRTAVVNPQSALRLTAPSPRSLTPPSRQSRATSPFRGGIACGGTKVSLSKPQKSYKNRKMTGTLLGYAETSWDIVRENGDKKFT
jgi:hypothetical protein